MGLKRISPPGLQNTLNELDTALEQWDSLTNKQVHDQPGSQHLQKEAKKLLAKLRDQLEEFEKSFNPLESEPPKESSPPLFLKGETLWASSLEARLKALCLKLCEKRRA